MNQQITDEIRQLAQNALVDSFWRDFSALVNKYVEAAQGLSDDSGIVIEDKLQDKCQVFNRDDQIKSDFNLNIHVEYHMTPANGSCGYNTLQEALLDDDASVILVHGVRVFERENGQWKLA